MTSLDLERRSAKRSFEIVAGGFTCGRIDLAFSLHNRSASQRASHAISLTKKQTHERIFSQPRIRHR